ncbi:hypothetical protein BKA64DRAFT_675711 [Cadophora sp. MPI-SDFR-AT-0126]|nr:hypothetical protein BKA64DRAFT_675711 [Leotiomycetes sp. MPI-SDFR-AT-0126]
MGWVAILVCIGVYLWACVWSIKGFLPCSVVISRFLDSIRDWKVYYFAIVAKRGFSIANNVACFFIYRLSAVKRNLSRASHHESAEQAQVKPIVCKNSVTDIHETGLVLDG